MELFNINSQVNEMFTSSNQERSERERERKKKQRDTRGDRAIQEERDEESTGEYAGP